VPATVWLFSGYVVISVTGDGVLTELQELCGLKGQQPSVPLESAFFSSCEAQTLKLQVQALESSSFVPVYVKVSSLEGFTGLTWALSQAGVTIDPGISSLHSSVRSHASAQSVPDATETAFPNADSSRSSSRRGSGIRRRLPSGITTTPGHPSSVFFVVNRYTDNVPQRCV
jgi:hypothetical protein